MTTTNTTGLYKFLRDSAITFSQRILSLVFGFIVSVILARTLGKSGVGVLTLVLLFPSMTVTFVNFGVPAATVYLVGSRKYTLSEAVFNNLVVSLFLSALGIIGAMLALVLFKAYIFSSVDTRYLYWALLIIPFNLIGSNLRILFQALSNFKLFSLLTVFPLFFNTVVFVWLFFFGNITVLLALWTTILSSMFSLILVIYFLSKYVSLDSFERKLHFGYLKDSINYGWKNYISSVFTFFNYKQDRFLLNAYLSPASVGVYNVGANFGEKLWMVSQSVSTVLFPKIASLEDNEAQRRWMTPFIARHIFTGTAILALMLFFLTPTLIHLLYGDEFRNAATVLRIILPGVVFLTLARIVSNDIAGRGHPGVNTILSGISLVINLTANILLIPEFGVFGAAWASTISYTADALLKVSVYSYIAKVSWLDVFFLRLSDFQVWQRLARSLQSKS
jgi:O-antigen/teichoic acid export membrane protein